MTARTTDRAELAPLLEANGVTVLYGRQVGCREVSLELWPGEVLAIVGESGSGKTTLLRCLAGMLPPTRGRIDYRLRDGGRGEVYALSDAQRRALQRSDWGFIYQTPAEGLRMNVSAGANVGERLMALGVRHYGEIRREALSWLERLEIDTGRIDERPEAFSGGMRQRLQIARNLVTAPRLVFMDEPTGGLDVSVQARILDTLRGLVRDMGLSMILVTHDLGVARLLADRMLVMKDGEVVEEGLTDQILEDPQHAYAQLLVSSILPA